MRWRSAPLGGGIPAAGVKLHTCFWQRRGESLHAVKGNFRSATIFNRGQFAAGQALIDLGRGCGERLGGRRDAQEDRLDGDFFDQRHAEGSECWKFRSKPKAPNWPVGIKWPIVFLRAAATAGGFA